MATTFPKDEKTYAVVLTPVTSLNKIETIAQALKRSDPDNIAIWSVAPFDATKSANWDTIDSALKHIARKKTVIEMVTQKDIDAVAELITVVK